MMDEAVKITKSDLGFWAGISGSKKYCLTVVSCVTASLGFGKTFTSQPWVAIACMAVLGLITSVYVYTQGKVEAAALAAKSDTPGGA